MRSHGMVAFGFQDTPSGMSFGFSVGSLEAWTVVSNCNQASPVRFFNMMMT